MTKQEINRILDSYYKEKQIQISLDFNERFNNAFESFPKFKELELSRRKLVLQTINNPDDEFAKKELIETKKQLSSFIKENHIDLTYKVSCQKCNDKGRTKDGICACRKTNLIKMLKESSNLPAIAYEHTFENNNIKQLDVPQSNIMSSLYEWISKKWITHFDNATKQIIFLSGNVGVGKTTLAFSTANALLDKGYSVYYVTAFDLNNIFVNEQFNRPNNERFYEILDCDCLIIDDLGTEMTNSIEIGYLFNVIDTRINNLKKTIICTNLDLEDFSKKYGERSASRLTNAKYALAINYIEGKDLRKIKQ